MSAWGGTYEDLPTWTIKKLRAVGWKPFFHQQLPADRQQAVVVCRVSGHYGSQVLLVGEAGEFRVPVQLAESAGDVADWLVLDAESSNCSHEGDAVCAIVAAIESGHLDKRRYTSFRKLNAEQAHNSRSLAERHERDRKTGRMYKTIINNKRRRRENL